MYTIHKLHPLATHFWYQIIDPAQLHWATEVKATSTVWWSSTLTEDTSMMTVFTCGVNFRSISGLEKRLKHWTYTCTFVAFVNIHSFNLFSFHLGCNFETARLILVLILHISLICEKVSIRPKFDPACMSPTACYGIRVNNVPPWIMSPRTLFTSEYCPPGHYSLVNNVPFSE